MKILIVDDEEMIRGVLREYVEFEGNEAYEAADGMEAVKKCKDEDFDLVLMDVMMPRLDGFSAVKEIRKFKDTPVIMLVKGIAYSVTKCAVGDIVPCAAKVNIGE
jgi:DNA-binding response OmpR family regulator